MLASKLLLLLATASRTFAQTKGVSSDLYNDFVHFLAVSQAAYAGDNCVSPGGLTRLTEIAITGPDIHGFILRDDRRRQIVTAFRGTNSSTNESEDINWNLTSFDTIPSCVGCQVHAGYYVAWITSLHTVERLMETQAANYPDYGMVITGHSLGAGIATLAAAQFSAIYKNLTIYTYGEPRIGNPAFATFIDDAFEATSANTTRFFRVTHENDGVPPVPPVSDGYQHHGTEFWSRDPPSANNTYVCGGETTLCCVSQGGVGVNAAHITYFSISSGDCVNK